MECVMKCFLSPHPSTSAALAYALCPCLVMPQWTLALHLHIKASLCPTLLRSEAQRCDEWRHVNVPMGWGRTLSGTYMFRPGCNQEWQSTVFKKREDDALCMNDLCFTSQATLLYHYSCAATQHISVAMLMLHGCYYDTHSFALNQKTWKG